MVVEHVTGLTALAFSSCGRRLATGGKDGAVILWDAQTGRLEQRMEGGQYATIHSLSFSSDGAHLARGSVDGSFRVWDATSSPIAVHFPPKDNRTLAIPEYGKIHLSTAARKSGLSRGARLRHFLRTDAPSQLPVPATVVACFWSTLSRELFG